MNRSILIYRNFKSCQNICHLQYRYLKNKRCYCVENSHNVKYKANWDLNATYIMAQPDSESPMAQFIVSYIDTSEGLNSSYIKDQPIALFLHDCLSTVDTFMPMLNKFIERGYRIIIPSLVGEGQTKGVTAIDESIFEKQMLGERTIFLMNFLHCIAIKKVEVAIGHSLSCLTLLAMGSVPQLPIKIDKVIFLNSIPAQREPKWLRPSWLSFLFLRSYDHMLTRPLFFIWFKLKIKSALIPFTDKPENFNLNNILHILRIGHGVRFDNIKNLVAAFLFNKLPLMSISCREDAASNYVEMVEFMKVFNLAPKHLIEYNILPKIIEEKAKDQGNIELPLSQFIVLPGKSHFPITTEHDLNILMDEIFVFLNCKLFRY